MVGMLLADVFDGFLEGNHAVNAVCLIEGQIGLEGYAIGCCSVDDGFVELNNRIMKIEQMGRNLLGIGIETYAKERFLCEDLLDELFSGHDFFSVLVNDSLLRWYRNRRN